MEFNDQSYVRSTKLLDFCPRRVYLSDESEHDSKHLWISNFEPVISENLFTTSCSMCAKQLIRPSEWKAIAWSHSQSSKSMLSSAKSDTCSFDSCSSIFSCLSSSSSSSWIAWSYTRNAATMLLTSSVSEADTLVEGISDSSSTSSTTFLM